MPENWLRRYLPLAAAGETVGDRVRFRQPQAALLDALLEDAAAHSGVDVDEDFAVHARNSCARARSNPLTRPPASPARCASISGKAWGGCSLSAVPGSADVSLTTWGWVKRSWCWPCSSRAATRRIAVGLLWSSCREASSTNWLNEAARFAPSLRVADCSSASRDRAGRLPDADVLLITYGTLRRDVLWLKDIEADYVILDEAQAIKNANTASAKAARLLNARYRLVLTGTPIENHLGELWSLFEFLNPGVLGDRCVRARRVGESRPETISLLARGLRPFILRRTKQQVARELPARTEQTLLCELETRAGALREVATAISSVGGAGRTRGRQRLAHASSRHCYACAAACHPALVEPNKPHTTSAKLEVLIGRVQKLAEGTRR